MNKCDKCNKNITKTLPGVECSQCEKTVHLNAACSGLNNKQRTALRGNESLGWTCLDCQQDSPKRRSIVYPDNEVDEDEDQTGQPTSTAQIDVKKLLRDISLEMEKAMRREIGELTQSLEFHTSKMDELVEAVEAFKNSVSELTKKNVELTNRNNHLQTRLGALEHRVQDLEQKRLSNTVIIANVPYDEKENPMEMVKIIASKMEIDYSEILEANRIQQKKEKPGFIQVIAKTESEASQWIQKAKSLRLTVGNLLPNQPAAIADQKIYIREALTPYNSKLLWTAKQQLKDKYKYVWCKKGVIRARKEDKADSIIIRTEEDIKTLVTK